MGRVKRYRSSLPDVPVIVTINVLAWASIRAMSATSFTIRCLKTSKVIIRKRAGQAGTGTCECILLYNRRDIMIQKFLIENSVHSPEQQAKELRMLNAMVEYCETRHCLRRYILQYFGEKPSWNRCENCGNCDQEVVKEDTTQIVRPICVCIDEVKATE